MKYYDCKNCKNLTKEGDEKCCENPNLYEISKDMYILLPEYREVDKANIIYSNYLNNK
jgi:RNA polymerase subunit RPABC4/transcription elongation factor Spt4